MFTVEFLSGGNRINSISVSTSRPKIKIGRNAANDIVISSNVISGNHAFIELINGRLYITDNGSTNGTFINNQQVSPGQPIDITDKTVFLAGLTAIQVLVKSALSSGQPPRPTNNNVDLTNIGERILEQLQSKATIIIGRSESADVLINNSQISRNHSKITKIDNKYFIEDLGSMNGTFVNGQRISGKRQIGSDDSIIIGRIRFTLGGLTIDISKEVAIKTIGLVKKFSNGKVGLHETNIEIQSNSLLAVMGPSGCGKSTLLKALNGESPGTSGTVYIGGQELNQNFDYLKMQIGYVPQDDIVHRELTVDESLWYAGKLRLPNFTDDQLKAKINQVLDELNIAHVRSNLVSAISGGQRKRVSIAVEILTDPLILFLDEPTSPLDPQTIEDFLLILKKLSEKGTTVIMVTHKPEDLVYMDQVIFMAEGGHICYYGKTNEYLGFFNVSDTVKVYSLLVKESKDRWVAKYQSKGSNTSTNSKSAAISKSSKVNYLSQYFWLTRRYLNIKFNDRVNSLIMVAQAPFIAAIICVLFTSISGGMPFLMAISSLWLGANNAAREIVSENAIFKRERMFNQGILTYIFSKITVLMLFSTVQSFLFVTILYFNFSGSSPELKNPIDATLWMMFISLVATLMGLLLSATVSTAEKVMSLVPIALIPQIMLAGVITKISNSFIEFFSYISISRWATEGFNCIQEEVAIPKMVITNKDQVFVAPPNKGADPIIGQAKNSSGELIDSTANAVTEVQRNYHADYTDRFGDLAGTLELDTYMLGILGMIFFIMIYISIRKKDTIQIN
jgi:ABC-type multidrug transport system ATPase subunit/pSer/pThr/pTyr-binding forkhead associated (FHA) protein